MSLTTPCVFGGGSLPAGVTSEMPGTGGGLTSSADRVTITIAGGSAKDSLFPGSIVDNSQGVVLPQADTDFDIAVEVGTDVHSIESMGFGIFVKVGSTTYIRSSWYNQAWTNNGNQLVRTEFSAYSTNGSTVTSASGGGAGNLEASILFGGGPSWFRLKRTGSSWTNYVSGDGVTWYQSNSWTAAITGVTGIKLGLLNSGAGASAAKSFDIFRAVDIVGTPDPRPGWFKTTATNVRTTDFSAGMPTWLTSFTGGGGTATVLTNKLRLAHTANVNGSYATVAYNGAATSAHGLLVQFSLPAGAGGVPFLDPGVMSNTTGTGYTDQYSPAGGATYIIEMPGSVTDSHIRAVRRTPSPYAYTKYNMAANNSINGFETSYTHMFGDSIVQSLDFGQPICMRLEYADGRFRCKWWQGAIGAEPGSWYFDGADRISQSLAGGIQSINWSHNNEVSTSSATDAADVTYLSFYDLSAVSGSSVVAQSGFFALPV